ncbi:MAG TPA: DUF4112 domain-containing protein [Tepidisphaeraceae bacterium]|nr:DUF4112 domain-containing protein [Tepidisphaeraceae bacterium]
METVRVNVRRSLEGTDVEADLAAARILARVMDAQFELGTVKFGLDAVLGLVPVVGDLASMMVGMYPIYLARKHGLGRTVILRMWANLAIDFAAGVVPVVGDVADVLIKANLKNVALLEKHLRRKYHLPA